ncbi:MAG: [FeFe] hydrogenase H-cluster maturation GTPase HydF [Eubacteriales bacterium]|nr:[FeFe] hydrogenase H-cluster maturation GTPase HydF [Eubacteriales bacterium]MDD4583553.1 [FeFe] hydrogenase H-cluster maturation GTPase HydF [Eubacteriales bacterium]
MSLSDTPRANRLHIGIFGRRNSGKSTLINALTGQEIALVSEVAGTTTDPVYKSMEIHGIGPCVFIDTAGFDDVGELGRMRVEKTRQAAEKTDIALMIFTEEDIEEELKWIKVLRNSNTPIIAVVNKTDILNNTVEISRRIFERSGLLSIAISAKNETFIEKIRKEIIRLLPEDYDAIGITGSLVKEGDVVLMVMPQDIQAPKGRLILPQVQTLRELLDKKSIALCTTTDKMDEALKCLSQPPNLIITDSQVFKTVYEKKPVQSKLTSFSVLFANYKGDLNYFVKSANAIELLDENSKVLIVEACTHAPLEEDIGRVKIPNLLRKKIGEGLTVDMVSGADFPEDLSSYSLIIHCGACMFNRKHVLSRVKQAKVEGIPMTNYGVVLAYLSGILDHIDFPN